MNTLPKKIGEKITNKEYFIKLRDGVDLMLKDGIPLSGIYLAYVLNKKRFGEENE
jgi:hypothetical protein